MDKIQRKLYKHCFQCGGEADWRVAGDSWCWKCDAAAHYAMGLQSVHDEVAKTWTPEWLIKEYVRLKEIEDAALRIRNEIYYQGGWDRTFEEHSGGALAAFDKLEPRQ